MCITGHSFRTINFPRSARQLSSSSVPHWCYIQPMSQSAALATATSARTTQVFPLAQLFFCRWSNLPQTMPRAGGSDHAAMPVSRSLLSLALVLSKHPQPLLNCLTHLLEFTGWELSFAGWRSAYSGHGCPALGVSKVTPPAAPGPA